MDTKGTIIEARDVTRSFGDVEAVRQVSLAVEAGTCYALLGPNGAGKTTLSRMIGAMLPRHGGELKVFGMDPWLEQSEVKSRLGVVLQQDALDEELDVLRNMEIYGRFFSLRGKALRARIDELLEFVELSGRKTAPIQALSGGMKRRLVVARSLLNTPRILLLDEPTTGLDPQVRQAIWSMLRSLKSEGMTILLTTHYMDEASQLADRVGIMDRGRLIVEDTPCALVQGHLPEYVLELDAREDKEIVAGLEARVGAGERAAGPGIEKYGDRAYVFHPDDSVLQRWVGELGVTSAMLRRSTLEDVFLKLTGRGLDE